MFHLFDVAQNPYETMRGHFPPMVMFTKSVLARSLNSFAYVSITPRKLTYLYQKFNFIAISRWSFLLTHNRLFC